MTSKPTPAWPLPFTALAQVWVATVLVSPLREPGAPWSAVYATLSAIGSLVGLAILALVVRNCIRLWRVQPSEASWALVAASGLVGLFTALAAAGPMTIGVWHWTSLVPATLAAYMVVILAREVNRQLAPSNEPSCFVDL